MSRELQRYCIDADTEDPETLSGIHKILGGIHKILEDEGISDCWRHWGFDTKTIYISQKMMERLTKAYPDIIFRLDDDDGARLDITFYLGGIKLDSHDLIPRFPSRERMKEVWEKKKDK